MNSPSKSYVKNVFRLMNPQQLQFQYYKYILDNGILFNKQDIVWSIELSKHCELKQCYANCQKIMTDSSILRQQINKSFSRERFDYYEGFALSVIPIEHAWLVHRQTGKVVDPTWALQKNDSVDEASIDYFGIQISKELIENSMLSTKSYTSILWQHIKKLIEEKK